MDMTEVSLTAAVRAALAVEMLRDLVEVDRDLVMDEASRGVLMPQDVFVLHFEARVDGKPVRSMGQLVADIDAGLAPAVADMRVQLRRHAVDGAAFDAAGRKLLVGQAQ